jgi:hypothetical protein
VTTLNPARLHCGPGSLIVGPDFTAVPVGTGWRRAAIAGRTRRISGLLLERPGAFNFLPFYSDPKPSTIGVTISHFFVLILCSLVY